MEIQDEKKIEMFRMMYRIRAFEEQARQLYMEKTIRGSVHLYVGEEAIATGICQALNKEDYILSNHRGHGHCLAKGGDPHKMMAELFGRTDGYCKGKGGSMHIADFECGILGANGIVGGGISLATGAAFTCKYLQNGRVAVCFFGDGAINQGVFYESANMAALWKLPVIYVCERNQFQQVSYSDAYYPDQDLTKRTEPFGFKGIEVDGNNVLEVYEKTCEIVKRVRKGEGPAFIVANTYRIYGHHMGDSVSYRRPGELEIWKDESHDPIMRMKIHLLKEEILSIQELESITKSIDESIINSVKYAEKSPLPEPESLMKDIYSD